MVYIDRATATLNHVTVANNQSMTGVPFFVGAIYVKNSTAHCKVNNSIVWGNAVSSFYNKGGLTLDHSIYSTLHPSSSGSSSLTQDAGNSTSDPLLANFIPGTGSPAINAGSDGKNMGALFPEEEVPGSPAVDGLIRKGTGVSVPVTALPRQYNIGEVLTFSSGG